MKWTCQITTMRLLKKAKKEHLIPLLEDFGVPTKGSKEELSTLLAEQLHYETDNENNNENDSKNNNETDNENECESENENEHENDYENDNQS